MNGQNPHRSAGHSWTRTTPAVPLPTRTPSRLVPSAAWKRTSVALVSGAPQRALGCSSGCAAGAVEVLARAAVPPVVAAPPPDREARCRRRRAVPPR